MADFPPTSLVGKEDSKYRTQKPTDPSMRTEVDGGYVITRPRFTRTPTRTFMTGFTQITQAQLDDLESFWDAHFGGSASFTWTDPATARTYTVRFVGPYTVTYTGAGTLKLWDISDINLETL